MEGAGHCGSCHTPTSVFGATDEDEPYGGSELQGWFAPDLTRTEGYGVGGWTVEEIVTYLKTRANEHSSAAGPMADVVAHSTQHVSVDDLTAMAVYLKDLAQTDVAEEESGDGPVAEAPEGMIEVGAEIYVDNCIGCHMTDGRGQADTFPPLPGNPTATSEGAQ